MGSRVSTQVQAEEGESLEVQPRQIEGRAMQEGWILSEIFVERAVSGARPFADREQGSTLLARLQPRDVIVAAKLDRIAAPDRAYGARRSRRDRISHDRAPQAVYGCFTEGFDTPALETPKALLEELA
jgi:DNA invertase Pin-like site-specific DNA recombinase